jgi:ubiquinone/menaquinone biosynthesis C-methylase UbiE
MNPAGIEAARLLIINEKRREDDFMLHRFYSEFAPYWPLISPLSDYEEEGNYFASLLRSLTPEKSGMTLLELGSGGGHCSSYIKKYFSMTLTDLSKEMLAESQKINPECEHLPGDMRTIRLGREFDAVFIHDAIDYMITADDLRAALTTAYLHCKVGGVCVIAPDHIRENLNLDTDCDGNDGEDGRAARFLEWSWDPDPNDDWVQTEYSFVFRDASGKITSAHESHRTGSFSEARWLSLLKKVGFTPEKRTEETEEDRTPRIIFVGHKKG